MTMMFKLAAAVALLCALSHAQTTPAPTPGATLAAQIYGAVAYMYPIGSTSTVTGNIEFRYNATTQNTTVFVNLQGLAPNTTHGIHVHSDGDLSAIDTASSTGPHFVGAGSTSHGCPGATARHAGDMGNWNASATGAIIFEKTLTLLPLTGVNSIMGRAVIVHADPDDCSSSTNTGNAGARISAGVIGIYNPGSSSVNIATSAGEVNEAIAIMRGTAFCANCTATVTFTTEGSGVRIRGMFNGLPAHTYHGFHIHEFGDLESVAGTGTSLGPHWFTGSQRHNVPTSTTRHFGDLGNIQNWVPLGTQGEATFYYDAVNTYFGSVSALLGRGIIVHMYNDKGDGQDCDQAGSSGPRVSVGVIGIRSTNPSTAAPLPATFPITTFNNTYGSQNCSQISSAVAYVRPVGPAGSNNVTGDIKWNVNGVQSGYVRVAVNITGLVPNSVHGIHVHQDGDLSNLFVNGTTTGPHFQGANPTHGCPNSGTRHFGDMGNWTADASGKISFTKYLDLLSLQGENSIVGRAVVVHNGTDDCTGTTGNSGSRIGAAVIGVTNPNPVGPTNITNTAFSSRAEIPMAMATLQPTSNCPGGNCTGTVFFRKKGNSLWIVGRFYGLDATVAHGFHVHQYGDLANVASGVSLGGHYKVGGELHNLPSAKPRHQGDLGNIQTFQNGIGYYNATNTNIATVQELLGRGIVVHLINDKGNGATCDQAGSAGARVMVGVIGYANSTVDWPSMVPPIATNNNFSPSSCDTPAPTAGSSALLPSAAVTVLAVAFALLKM